MLTEGPRPVFTFKDADGSIQLVDDEQAGS